MQFEQFRDQIKAQAKATRGTSAFQLIANVDRDAMWQTYLDAFATEESRQDHNCNCCRSFIKQFGALVRWNSNLGKIESIWDNVVGKGEYEGVAEKLAEFVKNAQSIDIFRTKLADLGTFSNIQTLKNENAPAQYLTRYHFHLDTPAVCHVHYTDDSKESVVAELRTDAQLLKKAFDRLSYDGINTVLELIDNDTLYRGKEYQKRVQDLLVVKQLYDRDTVNIKDNLDLDAFTLTLALRTDKSVTRAISSVIGTVLLDISDAIAKGEPLDKAVFQFNNKMDPTNFKRPKAVITANTTQKALEKIKELGLENALERRLASIDDIDVKDVLYINDNTTHVLPSTGGLALLESMVQENTVVSPNLIKTAKDIKIDDFISTTLKNSSRIEILFEGSNQRSLVSLITEKNPNSGNLFRWNNPFSWSYAGALADSALKEKVKIAGGKIEGYLRISLGWENLDDLDLHLMKVDTNGRIKAMGSDSIYFGNKSKWGGVLDVDMNVSSPVRGAVENIIFSDPYSIPEGAEFLVRVNNYSRRESKDNKFTVELEHNGTILTHTGNNPGGSSNVDSFRFKMVKGEIQILNPGIATESASASKEIWGINTNQFHDVNLITLSPNYWGDNAEGNKQLFFFINKAVNQEVPRGFFTEFLNKGLEHEGRVFEVLANRTPVASSENQLTGLGFSQTLRKNAIVRVTDSQGKQQLLKILF